MSRRTSETGEEAEVHTYLLRLQLLPPALFDGHLQSQVVAPAQPLFLPITETPSASALSPDSGIIMSHTYM